LACVEFTSTISRRFFSEFTEEDLPYNTFYGDGSPIESSVIAEIREFINKKRLFILGRKGYINVR
jgi:hypothetical protein